MNKVGLWQIGSDGPQKLQASQVTLERQLEDWIEADPNLLQAGLVVVGRQIEVDGGRLDLLALDPQGRWVIVEIKRGVLRRDTIAQVLDYASCLATLPAAELQQKIDTYLTRRGTSLKALLQERDALDALTGETREVLLYIVGTGKMPGLDRMLSFLTDRFQLPMSLVSFEVFELPDGQRVLARELTEPETADGAARPPGGSPAVSVEDVCALADQAGIGPSFRAILRAAEQYGLYPRPYKTSIMYTSPANRSRMLFTVWAKPTARGMKLYVSAKAFAEFYPIPENEAAALFGEDGWREMDDAQLSEFLISLRSFFERLDTAPR